VCRAAGVVAPTPAIGKIVDAYVRYGNRRALNEPRAHRVRLIANLKKFADNDDTSKPIAQMAREIGLIGAGLAKLKSAAG